MPLMSRRCSAGTARAAVRSITGTTTSMLNATSMPPSTPTRVPMKPISAPWMTKMPIIERGDAPSVRRIAMSALLVGDRHHLRRHDVECGDRDDQRQDDEHHALLDLHRAKEVALVLRPVAHVDLDPRHARPDRARPAARRRVRPAQPHAGWRLRAGTASRVVEFDQRERRCRTRTFRPRRCRRRESFFSRGSMPAGVTVPPGQRRR